jgi:hypothetical protein
MEPAEATIYVSFCRTHPGLLVNARSFDALVEITLLL